MYLNLHDYSGHPFQVQLSRELARRGHRVDHTYCAQYQTGRGMLNRLPSDPETLTIVPLAAPVALDKYRPLHRLRFEASYARVWRKFLETRDLDLAVVCNVPLLSLARMQRYFRNRPLPWVFWHQDIYSRGVISELTRRVPIGSAVLARRVEALEVAQVRNARQVVPITESFVRQYEQWGVTSRHATVIPNWAPLNEIAPVDRNNAWSREHGLPATGLRILYSGTLGRKHNPLLLLRLLDAVRARGLEATLVVCSEGVGADDLASAARGRSDVMILGFQPATAFSDVLSSADVVVALLEPDASEFSVPSKVLSYFSAGRATVGLMPDGNPAAVDIETTGGFVGSPDLSGVTAAADWIVEQSRYEGRLTELGRAARDYALREFDIVRIADRFEAVFEGALR